MRLLYTTIKNKSIFFLFEKIIFKDHCALKLQHAYHVIQTKPCIFSTYMVKYNHQQPLWVNIVLHPPKNGLVSMSYVHRVVRYRSTIILFTVRPIYSILCIHIFQDIRTSFLLKTKKTNLECFHCISIDFQKHTSIPEGYNPCIQRVLNRLLDSFPAPSPSFPVNKLNRRHI